MISNFAGFLIFLSVCGIVASSPNGIVDCRKFVFAPRCRGIAAKRDLPVNYDTAALFQEESAEHHLRHPYSDFKYSGEDDEDNKVRTIKTIEKEIENYAKMSRRPIKTVFKLLLGGRSNSERDFSPAQEFENL